MRFNVIWVFTTSKVMHLQWQHLTETMQQPRFFLCFSSSALCVLLPKPCPQMDLPSLISAFYWLSYTCITDLRSLSDSFHLTILKIHPSLCWYIECLIYWWYSAKTNIRPLIDHFKTVAYPLLCGYSIPYPVTPLSTTWFVPVWDN